jgi:hypothetical protein
LAVHYLKEGYLSIQFFEDFCRIFRIGTSGENDHQVEFLFSGSTLKRLGVLGQIAHSPRTRQLTVAPASFPRSFSQQEIKRVLFSTFLFFAHLLGSFQSQQ